MKSYQFTTGLSTLFLVAYTILHYMQANMKLLGTMFIISPILVIWMAYDIIRNAPYNKPERTEEIPDDELSGWKGY